MIHSIKLTNNSGYKWFDSKIENREIWVKGFFIYNEMIYRGEEFVSFVTSQTNETLIDKCCIADGHFSILVRDTNGISIISDHMRSFPIIIINNRNEICITDSINNSDIGDYAFDDLQKIVYENSLFTLEEKTLFKNITQVPAGVCCTIDGNGISYKDYWQFRYSEKQIKDENVAVKLVTEGYDKLFALCKKLIGEKNVVIPLSGGYDSRLVLNGLLKSGMKSEQIITFTYGKSDYEDGIISKKIADSVGVRHYFIDYCTKQAKKFFKQEFSAFSMYAGMTISVPCIQEWYAVSELKRQGIIDENCIFMPGYGGILPGHYIREFMLKDNDDLKKNIRQHIKNTLLLNKPRYNDSEIQKLQDIFINSKYFMSENSVSVDYIEGYERLVYAEEQSKFILNAVRDYEYVGCEWITPFFLKKQYDVWGLIDNELRWCNKAFLKCMETYFLPELSAIPFTGSKVKRAENHGFDFLNKISNKLQLIFNRQDTHYLLGMIPNKTFYTSFVKNKFAVSINHLVGCEYIKVLNKAHRLERKNHEANN